MLRSTDKQRKTTHSYENLGYNGNRAAVANIEQWPFFRHISFLYKDLFI